MPDLFADHFSKAVHVLDAKIPLNINHPKSFFREKHSSNFFAFPCTSAEVSEVIIGSKKKSSPKNRII